MTDSRHIPQEDLALYAMQALAPGEAAQIRGHVSACAECREELAQISGDLALVALSVEQQPLPEGARARFLHRVAADAAAPAAAPTAVVAADRPKRSLSWSLGISWAAVAALILLCLLLEGRNRSLRQQVQMEDALLQQQSASIEQQKAANARAQQVLDLLTARDAQHVLLTAAQAHPAPTARAVYLASTGSLLLQANHLDAVPAGKTYELWVIPAKGGPIPAGLFRPDAAGSADVVLPDIPKGVEAKAFGVTIENASGSATPTLPIVLVGAVPAAGE